MPNPVTLPSLSQLLNELNQLPLVEQPLLQHSSVLLSQHPQLQILTEIVDPQPLHNPPHPLAHNLHLLPVLPLHYYILPHHRGDIVPNIQIDVSAVVNSIHSLLVNIGVGELDVRAERERIGVRVLGLLFEEAVDSVELHADEFGEPLEGEMLPVVAGLFEQEREGGLAVRGLDVADEVLSVEDAEHQAGVDGEGLAAAEVVVAFLRQSPQLSDQGAVDRSCG